MAEFRSYAYDRLEDYDVGDSAVGFFDELLAIADELLELESQIAEYRVGWTGFKSYSTIQSFEERYVSLVKDIKQANEAVVTGEPWQLERCEHGFSGCINDFFDLQRIYAGQINELERASARVSQLLESKRSAVHARVTATLSTAAVVISAFTLFANLIV